MWAALVTETEREQLTGTVQLVSTELESLSAVTAVWSRRLNTLTLGAADIRCTHTLADVCSTTITIIYTDTVQLAVNGPGTTATLVIIDPQSNCASSPLSKLLPATDWCWLVLVGALYSIVHSCCEFSALPTNVSTQHAAVKWYTNMIHDPLMSLSVYSLCVCVCACVRVTFTAVSVWF